MDVKEMRHVHDVVHDLTAVRTFDDEGLPRPAGPLVTEGALDARDGHLRRGRVSFGVVPHEQLLVLLHRDPGLGASAQRHPLGVGHRLALAVAAPAPIVEGAGDFVALDGALRQVTAHVPAIGVEHVDHAVLSSEDDELLAERLDGVRRAVPEGGGQAKAVPATGEPGLRLADVDLAHGILAATVVGPRHLNTPVMANGRNRTVPMLEHVTERWYPAPAGAVRRQREHVLVCQEALCCRTVIRSTSRTVCSTEASDGYSFVGVPAHRDHRHGGLA